MDLLRKQDIDYLVKGVDLLTDKIEKKTLGTRILELIEKPTANIFFGQLNRIASPHVPDYIKDNIHRSFDNLDAKNYEDAAKEIASVPVEIIEHSEKLDPGKKEIIIGVINIITGTIIELTIDKKD